MKKWKGALTLTFALAVAGAANDVTGYALFNGPDGGNFFCDIDPTCRKLTDSEITTAQRLFGDAVNYSTVNVFSRTPLFLPIFNESAAVSSFGNIYDHKGYIANAAEDRYRSEYLLIHEMTHVWQYQHMGIGTMLWRSIAEGGIDGYAREDYEYDIHANEKFIDFNLEQQGEIMAGLHSKYYMLDLSDDETRSEVGRRNMRFYACKDMEAHQTRVAAFFPVQDYAAYCPALTS